MILFGPKRAGYLSCTAALALISQAAAAPSFPAVDAEPLSTVPAGAMVLHEGWQMHDTSPTGDDRAGVSQPAFSTAGWYETSVPTTVLGALVRRGIYPDPYIGTNNLFIPDASDDHNRRYNLNRFSHLPDKSNPWAKPYWFRREFRLPVDYRGKVVWLHLDGINYRADVWVNGRQVADSQAVAGMFRRFRFDVSSLVRPKGTNVLAVRIHPLDFPGDPSREQLGGLSGGFRPNGGDGEILRNVTEYCAIGWEWVPPVRDRNMGLWQTVWLEATGPVAVRDPAAVTEVRLPEGEEAAVTIRCHLDNAAGTERKVELTARISPEGAKGKSVLVRTNVTVPARSLTEVILKPHQHPALVLRQPRLWWPVTYGQQPLYRLTVEARSGGRLSSQATRLFGVRTVGSLILPSGGRAFTINGRTLRMTGGAWIPDFMMSWSAQRYRDEIRLMAEGNHTMVRVNGCGIVPPDVFFDACDRQGVLVWQDLSRTSLMWTFRKDGAKTWNPPPCDPALYLTNMQDCIIRLRGHPSMLVWCGSNEAAAQADVGEALQNELLPALDGTRPWLPSSHEQPSWCKEPMRVWTGGPWYMVRLPEYFKLYAENPRFTCRDEIGLASPPLINSLVQAVPGLDQPALQWFPLNLSLGYHDAAASTMQALDKILREDLGEPACLADYLWMSQIYNAASYRAIFEAANKVRPRNSGTHLWKSNAAWPSLMWQVFDWYLRPNAGYYAMRSACRPLHLQHSVDDQTLQVVSTLTEPRRVRVRYTLTDASGRPEQTEERPLTAAADATTPAGPLPALVKDGRLHFLALDLLDPDGRELERTVTWVQADCKWHELLKLPPANIAAKVLDQSKQDGETIYRISVSNRSKVPGLQVWLEVLAGVQGQETLPSFWSDNAMNLLPGEHRELSVQFRTKQLGGKPPHLMIEGWNVLPRQLPAAGGVEIPLAMKVTDCKVSPQAGNLRVEFSASQQAPSGPRWTTWPVPVRVDGDVARYVRLALGSGLTHSATLTLTNLPSGTHRITVGDAPEQTISW
jgi:hypothetical protein